MASNATDSLSRRWFALLDGRTLDSELLKRHFPNSHFFFDEIDGKFAVSSPLFEACDEHECAIDAAAKLLDQINVTLSISEQLYKRFELHGMVERRDGVVTNRTMIAQGAAFGISVVSAVGSIVGQDDPGIPTRSKEERLVSLIARDKRVGEISHLLATRPITWQAMRTAYESIVGIATGNRKHYRKVVDKGWLTIEESNTFYDTASFHTHGHPRTAPDVCMEYEAAVALSKRLFWHLAEDLEPK